MRKYKNAGEEMYNLLFVAVIKIMAKSNSEKKRCFDLWLQRDKSSSQPGGIPTNTAIARS